MNGPESALYLSGGGFSNLWDQPAYQRSQVEGYLKTAPHLPAASYFNRTGRAYPDVSAQAWNFIIVVDTTVVPGVAGTSCAAPTFAGIVALLNDIRLNAGKPPIGPLNPLLYKMAAEYPSTFTDIQSGSNPGCNTEGFQATKGWDPASGLGTPVYSEMAKYILKY
jgi:tripeptidyl-peptidase-1